MATTLSFEAKKLNLVQSIMDVDTDVIIDKVAKYLKRINKTNNDETEMSEEEFYAKIDSSIAQIEHGECVSLGEGNSVEDFIDNL